MSTSVTPTTPAAPAPGPAATIALTDDGIPFTRLVTVELRKLINTRAGFWLTASIGLIAAVVMVGLLIAARNDPADLNFGNFLSIMGMPTSILLPVLAILLLTSEWGQRTALATFTMEPRRERIIAAKLVASILAALVAVVLTFVLAAIGTALAGLLIGGAAGSWSFSAAGIVNVLIVQLAGVLLGFALAAILLNTPGAIVAFFALPVAMSILASLIPGFNDGLGTWIDLQQTQLPFMDTEWASGGEWARFAVSALIWIALPLGLGIARVLQAEVK